MTTPDQNRASGRPSNRNVEGPASPAAIMNGNSGKQQLAAARILPMAAMLAAIVCAPLDGDGVPSDTARLDIADLTLLNQASLSQRTTIDRLESRFHPKMRNQLSGGHDPSIRDLETGLPR